jgi:hypothetical protein
MLIAIALLMIALLPLAYSFVTEKRLARSYYQRAIAMEIVDGEMEVLAAGEWRSFAPGLHDYPVRSTTLTNLPPGKFQLDVETNKLRLEWQPSVKMQGGPVVREVKVQ